MLGIDVMQISRYERGLTLPSIEKAFRLAHFLQVTVDELLSGGAQRTEPDIKDIRLYQRFRAIDGFPKEERESAFFLLDALIAKHRMDHLTDDITGPRAAQRSA
jgi:transcriptional regulator with XRE-family HTH domain